MHTHLHSRHLLGIDRCLHHRILEATCGCQTELSLVWGCQSAAVICLCDEEYSGLKTVCTVLPLRLLSVRDSFLERARVLGHNLAAVRPRRVWDVGHVPSWVLVVPAGLLRGGGQCLLVCGSAGVGGWSCEDDGRLWCSTCFGPPTSRYVEGSWVLAGFVRWGHVLGRLQPTAFCTTARRRTVLPPRLPCELHECLVRGRSATPACLGTSRRTRSVTCLPYLPVACRAGRPLFRSRAVRDCTAVPASGAAATATHKGSGSGRSPSTPSWCGAREGPLQALPRGLLLRRLLFAVSWSVGAARTAIALGAQSGAHDQRLRPVFRSYLRKNLAAHNFGAFGSGNSDSRTFSRISGQNLGKNPLGNPDSVRILPGKILTGSQNGRQNHDNPEDRDTGSEPPTGYLCWAKYKQRREGCAQGVSRHGTNQGSSPGTNYTHFLLVGIFGSLKGACQSFGQGGWRPYGLIYCAMQLRRLSLR